MNIILLLALVLVCLSSSVQGKRFPRVSLPSTVKSISEREEFQRPAVAPIVAQEASKLEIPKAFKLLIGAGGIYAAFLYYGKLQEEVFHYKALDGSKFTQAWFLQALEALANVIVGAIGLFVTGGTKELPLNLFALSGGTQVCAKAFTSLALAQGVSFPVVTLAKSGKMVPVMIGSLLFGGAKYTLREYASVLAIIVGTTIVSMGKKSSGKASSAMGIAFVVLSLACDGIVGGMQSRLKAESKKRGVTAKPYDMMFWTNLFMMLTATVFAVALNNEAASGIRFCLNNPVIMEKIVKFALCSAVGQSFIFYTISNFDPLVCTTVTTTRKVFSVLLSIFLNGHAMSKEGWFGILLASAGILSELQDKSRGGGKKHH
jgi:UDP-galactose transporter B1